MSRCIVSQSLILCILCCCLAIGSSAQQKPVLANTTNDSVRVVISGSKHPLARPEFDIGSVDPGTRFDRMLLVLGASSQQEKDLQKFLDSQQDKGSPDYHHWLVPREFAEKFGPAPQDVAVAKDWLLRQGFTINSVAQGGRWIDFSGTARQAEHAFNTVFRQYQVGQYKNIANATDISLPAQLSPVVRGVVSLHSFFKKPMLSRYLQAQTNVDGTYSPISPDATLDTPKGPIHALTPGDYTKIYDLGPLYSATPASLNGAGVTIAVVARSDVNVTDFSTFRQITGLPPGVVSNIQTLPPDPGVDTATGDGVEAALDAEWAGAVAPGAAIDVVVSSSTATTDGIDLSAAYVVDHNLAPVMSVSFGDCESQMGPAENAFYSGLWQQAAAEGISVLIASGDSGAAGCDLTVQPNPAQGGLAVNGISSTPFNTAVGGTQFQENGNDSLFWSALNSSIGVSVNGYIPEVVWNESCDPTVVGSPCATSGFVLASGGGGASTLYAKPAWQGSVAGVPNDLKRDVPDVSLSAASHDGYVICFNESCNLGQVGIVGGTSASSPSFAGMMAIVNQVAGRQGLANYKLYELAQQPGAFCDSAARTNPAVPPPTTCIFNDVVRGTNAVPGQGGFNAAVAFDLDTGLGSVNAANLVSAWQAITLKSTALAISSNGGNTITAPHGQPVPLTITVTGASATSIPTGTVDLKANGTSVGAVTILPVGGNTGTFDGTTSNLPGGTYNLTAHYPGDGQFAASDSNTLTVNISPELTSTTLRTFGLNSAGAPISASTFPYGSFMKLHAGVAGASGQGSVTGSVSFLDVGTSENLGTAQMNVKGESEALLFGVGTFPQALTVGTHTIRATYSGDSSFRSSNSAPATVTITKGTPQVDLRLSDTRFVATQPGRLTVVVRQLGNLQPTGTVQFFDAGASIGTPIPLQQASQSQAQIEAAFDNDGQHSITASYTGDGTYTSAVSAPLPIFVSAPFSFGGSTFSATVAAGQTTTFKLNVGPTSNFVHFSGTVTLSCSSPSAAVTCTVNPGSVAVSSTAGGSITVNVATAASAGLRRPAFLGWPTTSLAGIIAFVLIGCGRKSKPAFGAVALMLVLGAISCGGGGSAVSAPAPTPTPVPPTHTTLVVQGSSGTHVNSIALDLTITH